MAYRKPNVFVRKIFNPIAMKLGIGGTKALTVAGRRTGVGRTVPVIVLDHDGGRYLVSPRGETDWVRNIRASGRAQLSDRHGKDDIVVHEVPNGERAPVLAAYRKRAGKAVEGHFKALPDPADHPVFRIEP